ncbi:MAG: hypothetical protein ACHQ1H_04755 [Nitrososphaerales archaeon]
MPSIAFANSTATVAPVSFSVSPNPVKGSPNTYVPVTVTWTNRGTHTFVAKSCVAWFSTTSKSGPWTKGTGCFKGQPFPYTIGPGKVSEKVSQYIASHLLPGTTVYFKVIATGTYNGAAAQSTPTYFSLIVT